MFPKREDGGDPRTCPTCGNGRLGLKLGRFGAFIGCSNYPECRFTRQLGRPDENGEAQPRELGVDPKSGETVALKSGRFGPYVQLGEQVNGEKPPRAGIPKGFTRGYDRSRNGAQAARAAARSGHRIPKPASRSWRASGGLAPSSSMTAPMPRWSRPKTCSRSASIARSRCSPSARPKVADHGAAVRR